MLAVRIISIFLVLGGLALFTLQNMSPALPLVILGSTTPALPLAVWIGGAIVAGALTALFISGLSSLGRPAARRVVAQRPAANRFGDSFRAPGAASRPSGSTESATRLQDDWEAGGRAKEEWDDWEDYQQPAPSRSSQPEIRDRMDESWANWEGYEDPRHDRSDDCTPPRTDFEVKQEPTTSSQTGSIYSYRYNKSEPQPEFLAPDDAPPRRPGVYDADYRVITPPYRPDPEATPSDEDWGLEDDSNRDQPDNDRRL